MFNKNQEAGPEREWARLGDEQQELQVEAIYDYNNFCSVPGIRSEPEIHRQILPAVEDGQIHPG